MQEFIDKEIFRTISRAAAEIETEAYVVGGYVRDSFMGMDSKDVDIVAVGSGIELAGKVAAMTGPSSKMAVFKNFGTAMVRVGAAKGWEIEFVGARKESYRRDSRKPIVEDGTLEDDLRRRDFTINTMAISLNADDWGRFLDPFSGIRDLDQKIIRTPLDPEVTFSDDPLRMMRAIRFATRLGFEIDPGTFGAIVSQRDRMAILSAERIADELNKILMSDKPSRGFMLMDQAGLLQFVLPQLIELKGAEYIDGKGHKDNFNHTLQVLDNVAERSDDLWLRWAALLHDIAKPVTKKFDEKAGWTFHGHEFIGARMIPGIFRKLKLPLNDKMKYVRKLVQLHLRPIALTEENVTDSAIRRLLFEAGDDIDDLLLLCEADITSKNREKRKRYLKNLEMVRRKLDEVEEKDRIRNWQPPISGEVIMDVFGLEPGKEVGIIKNAIREAILEGLIGNNYDEAYKFMIEKGKSMGLSVEK